MLLPPENPSKMTLSRDAIVNSASCSHLVASLVLSVSPVSSPSTYALSLYLVQHSSFKAVTSVFHPYLLSNLLALCPPSISASVSFYLFHSPLNLFFFPHLPLPFVIFFFFLNIDHRFVCSSLSLSLSSPDQFQFL